MGGSFISHQLTKEDKVRFTNLLELASSSEFDGERKNALAAARRIAEKYDLSIAEAARWEPDSPHPQAPLNPLHGNDVNHLATDFTIISENIHRENIEKLRWQSAVRAAETRGLNLSESKDIE